MKLSLKAALQSFQNLAMHIEFRAEHAVLGFSSVHIHELCKGLRRIM